MTLSDVLRWFSSLLQYILDAKCYYRGPLYYYVRFTDRWLRLNWISSLDPANKQKHFYRRNRYKRVLYNLAASMPADKKSQQR